MVIRPVPAYNGGMAGFDDTQPVALRGEYDESVSRWLWLVKWVLLIPHFIVLVLLHIAMFVVTVIAFFAILFTGRYPRALFDFSVGVLRWTWRVRFYGYGALDTDKEPAVHVAQHGLSRGFRRRLPRTLVTRVGSGEMVAVGHPALPDPRGDLRWSGRLCAHHGGHHHWGMIPLFVILIVVVIVALVFTGRYPRGLFGLLLGINRWAYRVRAYMLLMRDEYPPFRLDQGPHEPERSIQEAVQQRGGSRDVRAHRRCGTLAVGGEDRHDDRLVLLVGVGDLRGSNGNRSSSPLSRIRFSATSGTSDGEPAASAIARCSRESSRR